MNPRERCSDCPRAGATCLGQWVGRLCDLAASRPDYRRLLAVQSGPDQGRRLELAEALGMVGGCGHRGPVLPWASQPDQGCGCGERSECRLGRGQPAGAVTLRDCLACVAEREKDG